MSICQKYKTTIINQTKAKHEIKKKSKQQQQKKGVFNAYFIYTFIKRL